MSYKDIYSENVVKIYTNCHFYGAMANLLMHSVFYGINQLLKH
ncbi:hypothetical protein BMY_0367 [Wohlfahrtiimonas chitiniclastica]|nr:hypothetical protein BMY_0367 [Wohlfahrtiimonas chitiniclastica]